MKNVSEIKEFSQSNSVLWELAREGARTMIQAALIQEQEEFLANYSHLLDPDGRQLVVKNGYLPERNIKTSAGELPIKAPRVRRRQGADSVPEFSSSILPKYLRNSKEIDELIPFLYLKGISTNDFSEVLSKLLGTEVSMSASNVVRLKQVWNDEYSSWKEKDLSKKKYIYWWADGVYFNSRMDDNRNCILVIIGATEEGKKEIVAIENGFRESEISWREIFQDLKKRGLQTSPKLAIGDGALGFWKALRIEFPDTKEQRCWVHKTANVLDKFPKSLHASAKKKIHEIYLAETKEQALKEFENFVSLYESKYPNATNNILKDKNETLAFYDFPAEHWQHIRSTNPIESTFATVRLRTYKTKGSGTSKETLTMVFKMIQSAQKNWRRLRGFQKIVLVLNDYKFKNGVLVNAA